jgi:hypothetical protein
MLYGIISWSSKILKDTRLAVFSPGHPPTMRRETCRQNILKWNFTFADDFKIKNKYDAGHNISMMLMLVSGHNISPLEPSAGLPNLVRLSL